ncbi:MAG: TetR/AcrR family transcriptional regulator [Chloroflexi bacterium]|nr:TetR/AcrR family transcriptional regulator [Chloroflexota bacterium]
MTVASRRAIPVTETDESDESPTVAGHWRRSVGDRRRASSRAKILAAAAALFEQHSYTAIAVEKIAEAAGVGPATVYNRFGSKAMIVAYLLQEPARELVRATEADLAAEISVERAVRRHFARLAETACGRQPLFAAVLPAVIDAYSSGGAARPETDLRQVAPLLDPVMAIIEHGQRRGLVAASVDPRLAAVMVTNVFCLRMIGREPTDRIAGDLAELLLFGIVGRPTTGPYTLDTVDASVWL